MMPAAAIVKSPASPLILSAGEEETERLCLRDFDAIDGTIDRDNTFYRQYRGRAVVVTPLAQKMARGAAAVLLANKCDVGALPHGTSLDAVDLLAVPRKPMFVEGDEDALPRGETALALMEREMELITYLCEPWIPEGLNLLAGRPKIGKTTFQRQKLAAVAEGGTLFGDRCQAAPCAYLSLEEGSRLTRHKLESAAFSREALANITLFFDWRRGADGVLDLLRLLEARPELRYVAIDSLTKFRTIPDQRMAAFTADYEAVSALHGVAKARPGLSIDLVHHTRKAKSEDPIEDISGTFGISAAVDSFQIMRHHEDGAVLHVGGRLWDRETSQFQLRRSAQRWELVGEFLGLSAVQTETLTALRSAKGMSPTDGARFWSISKQSMMDRLQSLVNRGVAYSKAGVYFAKD